MWGLAVTLMELRGICYCYCALQCVPLFDHRVPKGLEDVSKYPYLFAELIRRGYSDSDIAKISRDNFLRVFKAVEKVMLIGVVRSPTVEVCFFSSPDKGFHAI